MLDPLVSIVVITYNSSEFVLETLESAKAQTYQNIELIISDDCSTDNTVDVCKNWLKDNKVRFVRTELITVEKNTGIPANCNRGVRAAKGVWVKTIAGDDILDKRCIEIHTMFIKENGTCKIIISRQENFISSNSNEKEIVGYTPSSKELEQFSKEDPHLQFQYFLQGNTMPGSATFIKTDLFELVNYFDEEYPLIEDIPFFLKVTNNGIPICILEEITVHHRVHPGSLTSNNDRIIISTLYGYYRCLLFYARKEKQHFLVFNIIWHKIFTDIIFFIGNKGVMCKLINAIRRYLQPSNFKRYLKKYLFRK